MRLLRSPDFGSKCPRRQLFFFSCFFFFYQSSFKLQIVSQEGKKNLARRLWEQFASLLNLLGCQIKLNSAFFLPPAALRVPDPAHRASVSLLLLPHLLPPPDRCLVCLPGSLAGKSGGESSLLSYLSPSTRSPVSSTLQLIQEADKHR